MLSIISQSTHTILLDPVWTLFPGSEGGAEVLLSLGFVILALILLLIDRRTGWPVAVAYLFAVLYFTILSRTPGEARAALLTPFSTIRNALGWDGWFVVVNKTNLYALFANILLFMPFGFILPSLFRFTRKWYIAVPFAGMASLGIELTQYFTRMGCFDVDDLIANTLGAGLGYLIYRIVLRK